MAIDYEAVINLLVQRKKISKKQQAEYLEDQDALTADLQNGKDALSLGWDCESPGSSGGHWITLWQGLYFVGSSDFEDEGPFETLEEALKLEMFQGPTPNPSLRSEVLSLAELLRLGTRFVSEEEEEEEGGGGGEAEIYINDVRYVLQDDELVRSDEEA